MQEKVFPVPCVEPKEVLPGVDLETELLLEFYLLIVAVEVQEQLVELLRQLPVVGPDE